MSEKTKRLVVVEAWVPEDASDAHPEHPIYIPVEPPPDSGLAPEHPIYIPVPPPEIWGPTDPRPTPPIFIPGPPSDAHPEHPIYLPVEPTHPIELPPDTGGGDLTDEQKEALRAFLEGNLPPASQPVKK